MDLMLFISSHACEKCPEAERIVRAIERKFRWLHVSVLDMDRYEHRLTALQFQVTTPPALVLDGERIFPKAFPTEQELIRFIEEKEKKAKKGPLRRERSRWWSISGLPEQWGPEPGR